MKSRADVLFRQCCQLYVPEGCHDLCQYEIEEVSARNLVRRNCLLITWLIKRYEGLIHRLFNKKIKKSKLQNSLKRSTLFEFEDVGNEFLDSSPSKIIYFIIFNFVSYSLIYLLFIFQINLSFLCKN